MSDQEQQSVVIRVRKLQTLFAKTKGLIGTADGLPVLFHTRFGIHTFGMNRPIDIVILDDGFRIVKMTESLPPNRFFFWNPGYRNVLESDVGFIRRNSLVPHMRVSLHWSKGG